MAVFDSETQSFWVSPKPKDESGVLYGRVGSTSVKTTPENIIPTNMLDKWKSQDAGRYGEGERSIGLAIGTRSTTDEIGRLNQMKQTHRINR